MWYGLGMSSILKLLVYNDSASFWTWKEACELEEALV